MTTAVMGDDAITFAEKVKHLVIPVVGGQWPSVVKNNGLGIFWPPVLVENLDAILGRHSAHGLSPSVCVVCSCPVEVIVRLSERSAGPQAVGRAQRAIPCVG